MDIITSESNPHIKEISKLLGNSKYRNKAHCFVAEGLRISMEALQNKKATEVFVSNSFYKKLSEKENLYNEFNDMGILFDEAKMKIGLTSDNDYECNVFCVNDNLYNKISDTVSPQGILCISKMPEYDFISDLNTSESNKQSICAPSILTSKNALNDDIKTSGKFYVALDGLADPGNLGTIIRTSLGTRVDGIILSNTCVDLFNPKVVRSTMGAIYKVPFMYTSSLSDTLANLRTNGIKIYATLPEGAKNYDKYDYTESSVIVIGNEANGISDEVKAIKPNPVTIPMYGGLESLNASVAAAVMMYEVVRQKNNQ